MSIPETPGNRGPLRLTLRTLLAWLDDTLDPEEAHSIGQKVAESRFAQDLVERIHKVTRRRRLTVPANSGPESSDPNLVASYLDNQLPSDQVAEYEERCLKSDVHLSEAASAHQILSLIGQKAKVPPESRYRMYRLVRGRDAVEHDVTRAVATAPEPAAAQIPEWSVPAPAPVQRREWGRMLALSAGLSALLLASAWALLPRHEIKEPKVLASNGPAAAVNPAPDAAVAPIEPAAVAVVPPEQPETVQAKVEPPTTEPTKAQPAESVAAATPATAAPGPALNLIGAQVAQGEGLVLRLDTERRNWSVIPADTRLSEGDQIVGLPPFKSPLSLDGVSLELNGPAAVQLLRPLGDEGLRFALDQGQVVLRFGSAPEPVVVEIDSESVWLIPPPDAVVGLARVNRVEPGMETSDLRSLEVYAPRGSVEIRAGTVSETLSGPGMVEVQLPDQIKASRAVAMPRWLSEDVAEVDRLTGAEFAEFFKPDTPLNRSLLEAIEDDRATIRELALLSLGAIGSIDLMVPALNRADEPAMRRTAATVLRAYRARNADSAKALRAQFESFGGKDWAQKVESLLVGYTAEAAASQETYTELVGLLDDPDVAVRALALDRLTSLTGRDPLGFDPDRPEEQAGKRAWQTLLREGQLRPAAGVRRAPAATPAPIVP